MIRGFLHFVALKGLETTVLAGWHSAGHKAPRNRTSSRSQMNTRSFIFKNQRQQNTSHNQRKFRRETADNMESWKAEQRSRVRRWKAEKRSRVRRKKIQLRESQKKEDTHARNVREVAKRCVFPMICVSSGSKSRLGGCGGSCLEEKWKIARRCGAKHISKSKCTKHTIPGTLEVGMWKNCMPLWREAHFKVKMYKTHHSRNTFWSWDVEKLHAAVARSTFQSQNVQNTPFSEHFWCSAFRNWYAAVAWSTFATQNVKNMRGSGHFLTLGGRKIVEKWHAAVAPRIHKSKCTKHWRFATLLEVPMSQRYKPQELDR